MPKGEQIDKNSKKAIKLSQKAKKIAKHQHKKYLRRIRKAINNLNPLQNRYDGWVG